MYENANDSLHAINRRHFFNMLQLAMFDSVSESWQGMLCVCVYKCVLTMCPNICFNTKLLTANGDFSKNTHTRSQSKSTLMLTDAVFS